MQKLDEIVGADDPCLGNDCSCIAHLLFFSYSCLFHFCLLCLPDIENNSPILTSTEVNVTIPETSPLLYRGDVFDSGHVVM